MPSNREEQKERLREIIVFALQTPLTPEQHAEKLSAAFMHGLDAALDDCRAMFLAAASVESIASMRVGEVANALQTDVWPESLAPLHDAMLAWFAK